MTDDPCKNGHNMEQQGTVTTYDKYGKPIVKGYYVCQNPGCSHTEQR